MKVTASLAEEVNVRQACSALAVPRASFYRWQDYEDDSCCEHRRPRSPLALSGKEETDVLEMLHAERFVDRAPQEIYNALLYEVPEMLAERANEVWSWDITKLRGPVKWTYFYLYVILDIFSRYVVGWMVAHRELASLAEKLIDQTSKKQNIQPGQLTIHADRGSSMTSKQVAFLMADLGITKSHSRPHVSNDNPYSESQFKTMKYRPEFPDRFGSIEDARSFCQNFFTWYNNEHYHSGIGFLTPEDVHYGRAEQIIKERQAVLLTAYEKHPERFKGKMPVPGALPTAVWINKPAPEKSDLEVH